MERTFDKCLPYVPEIQNCSVDTYHCYYSAIGGLIRARGYERLDLIMGKECDLLYRRSRGADGEYGGDYKPEIFCFGQFLSNLRDIDGISARTRVMESKESVPGCIEESLLADGPLLALVDECHLPYSPRFGKNHGSHFVIVYDYDESQGAFGIIEYEYVFAANAFRVHFIDKPLEKSQLADAVHGAGGTVLSVQSPPAPVAYDASVIRRRLEDIVQLMTSEPADGVWPGIAGIRAFASDVAAWPECFSRDRLARNMQLVPIQPIAAQRAWHSLFLERIGGTCRLNAFDDLAARCREVAQDWVVARNMLLKGSMRNPEEMVPRIARKLTDIADKEEAFIDALRSAVAQDAAVAR